MPAPKRSRQGSAIVASKPITAYFGTPQRRPTAARDSVDDSRDVGDDTPRTVAEEFSPATPSAVALAFVKEPTAAALALVASDPPPTEEQPCAQSEAHSCLSSPQRSPSEPVRSVTPSTRGRCAALGRDDDDDEEAPPQAPLPQPPRAVPDFGPSDFVTPRPSASVDAAPSPVEPAAVVRSLVQRHLDFGQLNTGAVTCARCGMIYTSCDADLALHKKYCARILKRQKMVASATEQPTFDRQRWHAACTALNLAACHRFSCEGKDYEVLVLPPTEALRAAPRVQFVQEGGPFHIVDALFPQCSCAVAVTTVGERVEVAAMAAFVESVRMHEPELRLPDDPPPRRESFEDQREFRAALALHRRRVTVVERKTLVDVHYCFISPKACRDTAGRAPVDFFKRVQRPTPERDRRNHAACVLLEELLAAVRHRAIYGVRLGEDSVALSSALGELGVLFHTPELQSALALYRSEHATTDFQVDDENAPYHRLRVVEAAPMGPL